MMKLIRDMQPNELFILGSSGEIFQYVQRPNSWPSSNFYFVTRTHDQRPFNLNACCSVLPGEVAKQSFQAIADAIDDWIAR